MFGPGFVVQALVSRGQDTKLADIFEALSGEWVPTTEAQFYPVLPTKALIAHEAQVLILAKRHIQFYQPAQDKAG